MKSSGGSFAAHDYKFGDTSFIVGHLRKYLIKYLFTSLILVYLVAKVWLLRLLR